MRAVEQHAWNRAIRKHMITCLLILSLPPLRTERAGSAGLGKFSASAVIPLLPMPVKLAPQGPARDHRCAQSQYVRSVMHLVGGYDGVVLRETPDADAEQAAEHFIGGKQALNRIKEYGMVARDPQDSDIALQSSDIAIEFESGTASDEEELLPWAEKETTHMRTRRSEDVRLISEFGGDLSVLPKDAPSLKKREWDGTLNSTLVSHAERKRREEEASLQAAGGRMEALLAKPGPTVFERDMRRWQAAGFCNESLSTKQRRQQDEEEAIKSFGGDLSAAGVSKTLMQRKQAWSSAWEREATMHLGSEDHSFISAKERKKREEEEALKAFGGGLDCLPRHKSALEKEKMASPFRLKKKDKKK